MKKCWSPFWRPKWCPIGFGHGHRMGPILLFLSELATINLIAPGPSHDELGLLKNRLIALSLLTLIAIIFYPNIEIRQKIMSWKHNLNRYYCVGFGVKNASEYKSYARLNFTIGRFFTRNQVVREVLTCLWLDVTF